jgi:DNA-binding MarR family transcriptional regulator
VAERLTFTLHELVAEIDAYADDLLRERYGVSFTHFEFLAVLSDVEPSDMTTLARCLGVTKAAVSKRVPRLVADGWISATSEPGTGRSVSLTLTPKGAELVHEAGEELEREFAAILADPALSTDPIDAPRLNRQLIALTTLVQQKSAARAVPSRESSS